MLKIFVIVLMLSALPKSQINSRNLLEYLNVFCGHHGFIPMSYNCYVALKMSIYNDHLEG